MRTISIDDDLGYAINQAVDELQKIEKNLPRGASAKEVKESIKQVDNVVYTLISSVDKVEWRLNKDEKGTNYIEKLIDDTNNNFKLPDMRVFASQLFGVCNQRKE